MKLLLLLFAATITESQISSDQLAARMKAAKPLVIHTGFNVLYRSAHIAERFTRGQVRSRKVSKR